MCPQAVQVQGWENDSIRTYQTLTQTLVSFSSSLGQRSNTTQDFVDKETKQQFAIIARWIYLTHWGSGSTHFFLPKEKSQHFWIPLQSQSLLHSGARSKILLGVLDVKIVSPVDRSNCWVLGGHVPSFWSPTSTGKKTNFILWMS